MSLKHAILVLLDREPGSGYDLAQRFNKGIGHFWQASHQQIYQQLKKLDGEKLVSFKTRKQTGKPDRKVYQITTTGKKALKQWMLQEEKPPVVRDALLIKIFAAGPDDYPALIGELDRHIKLHKATLVAHQALEADYFQLPKQQQKQHRMPYLTLRRGIRYEREWIEWLQETRSLIVNDRLPSRPA
ncbi:MAG: PadR family transcriptional regulator [Salinisphaeraceae bacterium]|nr:PadR family transcriptional regulator [Salinisphaeraceae bacterium]